MNPRRRCCSGQPRVRRELSSSAGRRLGRFCSLRGAAHARMRLLRSGCGTAAACCSAGVLSPRRRFCAGHNGQTVKTCFGCSAVCLKSKQLKRHHLRCCCGWVSVYAVVYAASRILARKTAPRRLAQEKRGGNDCSLKRQPLRAAAAPRRCVAPSRRRKAAQVRAARPKYRAPAAQK